MPPKKKVVINKETNDILEKHFGGEISLIRITKLKKLFDEGIITNQMMKFLRAVKQVHVKSEKGDVELNIVYKLKKLVIDDDLNDILKEMVNGIKDALENTPPELSADLVDMGLTLTGGGALLKNIDKRFSKETGLPVHVANDPLACVAIGTGKALDQEETFSTMLSEY